MNATDILQYGVIGLGFLLASLSYKLLTKEQAVEHPRRKIITSIYVFMGFSVLLCILGFVSELLDTDEVDGTIRTEAKIETKEVHDTVYITSSDSINVVIANYADSLRNMNAQLENAEFEVLNGRHIKMFYSGEANKRLANRMIEKFEELGMKVESQAYIGKSGDNSLTYCSQMGLKRSTAKLISKVLKNSKYHLTKTIVKESGMSNCNSSYFKLYLLR